MSPPPDGVTAQSRWPCGTTIRTYSLYGTICYSTCAARCRLLCHRWIPLTKARKLWRFLWSATEQTFKQTIKTPVIWDAIALIVTSLLCTFQRDENLILSYFIFWSSEQILRMPWQYTGILVDGSRVILVMCKNCSDISWHQINLNQSKVNCPKNLNSDGLNVREMGPWPECIFRSLLQFLVLICIHILYSTHQYIMI